MQNYLDIIEQITEEHFYEMFKVLPPKRYLTKGFMFGEAQDGNIHACFRQEHGIFVKYFARSTNSLEQINNLGLNALISLTRKANFSRNI